MIILNKPLINFLKQTYNILLQYNNENKQNKININYINEIILLYYKNIIKTIIKNCNFLKELKSSNNINNLIQFIINVLIYSNLNKELFDNIFNFLYFKKYLNDDINYMFYSSCSINSVNYFKNYEFTKYNKSDKVF